MAGFLTSMNADSLRLPLCQHQVLCTLTVYLLYTYCTNFVQQIYNKYTVNVRTKRGNTYQNG
jgi:hypothetical protein